MNDKRSTQSPRENEMILEKTRGEFFHTNFIVLKSNTNSSYLLLFLTEKEKKTLISFIHERFQKVITYEN